MRLRRPWEWSRHWEVTFCALKLMATFAGIALPDPEGLVTGVMRTNCHLGSYRAIPFGSITPGTSIFDRFHGMD